MKLPPIRPTGDASLPGLADIVVAWIDMVGSADWRALAPPRQRRLWHGGHQA